jgi:hypothetical protein
VSGPHCDACRSGAAAQERNPTLAHLVIAGVQGELRHLVIASLRCDLHAGYIFVILRAAKDLAIGFKADRHAPFPSFPMCDKPHQRGLAMT